MWIGVLLVTLAVSEAPDLEWRQLANADGSTLQYAVQLPADYEPLKAYPLLIALPPGPQGRSMVNAGFRRYWGTEAHDRGWIVVSPQAPGGELFFKGGERTLGPLLRQLRIDFRIEGNRFHLAGASNGGRSAFRLALNHPHEFRSLVVLPGFPSDAEDRQRLKRLTGLSIHMFVGGDDTRWLEQTRTTAAQLKELGIACETTELPGEGHVPPSLDGEPILELLTAIQAPHRPRESAEGRVAAALDDFHDAAAKGDEVRYFGRFAPEGVFLGTDATERWTLPEFESWGMGYFQRESAWIYVPQHRKVTLAPDGKVAWFDEVLGHARLGECRGTGVLRQIDGEWRIAQYNLTVPVPNSLMNHVAELIQRSADGTDPTARDLPAPIVYLVRHAEKVVAPRDPDPALSAAGQARAQELTRLLGSLPIRAIYASQYRRTQDTVRPLGTLLGQETVVVDAAKGTELVARIRQDHPGEMVLICGHSNTLPKLMKHLGVESPVVIPDHGYDSVFVVTPRPEGPPALARLRFGAPDPTPKTNPSSPGTPQK